jgi:predicted  nucleic acid-binding Zn-ribbon protein
MTTQQSGESPAMDPDDGESHTETNDTTVTLGDVTFDPVATNDFRLSVEGTSNTGKSNTVAAILEDLGDVQLPTLIIERLGALSTVRHADAHLIVVGAREAEGIDLAVSLDDLDRVGEWVLDRGMKLLVDVSTYAEPTAEESRLHLAAARAIRSLNERAHEKYRAGDRTASLVVCDEAHYIAPKDSAPEPSNKGDYVTRARGELIRTCTEGGNLGISTIVAYQRRAFLHNGVIQLCQDWIVHGLEADDAQRVARALNVNRETIEGLGIGEIIARGRTITDGELVGPTQVRKRHSPDPREETFELPEPSDDLAAVLDDIQSEVEAEAEKRTEREREIDRLEDERDTLEGRVEDLEEQLTDRERLTRALENLREPDAASGADQSDTSSEQAASQELVTEVEELRDEREALQRQVERAEAEAERANERRTDAEDRIEQLEAEREAITDIQEARTDLVETAETVLQRFGPDEFEAVPADMDNQSDALASARAENERLREQFDDLKAERDAAQSASGESEGGETSGEDATGAGTLEAASLADADLTTLLQHEAIQTAIRTATERGTAAEQHYGRVLSVLASAGNEEYRSATDVAALLDVSDATVRDVLKGLHTANVVTRETQGRGHAYALDRDLLEQRIDVAEQQAAIVGGPQEGER